MVAQQDIEIEMGTAGGIDIAGDAGEKEEKEVEENVQGVPVGDVLCLCRPTVAKTPSEIGSRSWTFLKDNKAQILSGITVALAQIPEAVSFSFVAGVSPSVGLQVGVIFIFCGFGCVYML